MNKQALITELQQTDLLGSATKKGISEFLDTFFNIIINEVAEGSEVSIPGFGKFYRFTSSTTGKQFAKFKAFKDFQDNVAEPAK